MLQPRLGVAGSCEGRRHLGLGASGIGAHVGFFLAHHGASLGDAALVAVVDGERDVDAADDGVEVVAAFVADVGRQVGLAMGFGERDRRFG